MRVADLGISIGVIPSGPTGSLLDVPGVGVGHTTIWRDDPPPPAGAGTARTGVTVIDMGDGGFRRPTPAGGATLNGNGECTGLTMIRECGIAETPIFLTSTMQVGRVYDAAVELLVAEEPMIGVDDVIIPIVGECDDSFLSDPRTVRVTVGDVAAALAAARDSAGRAGFDEGAVGAGTGMTALGYKGGIGSASRRLVDGHTVAVLTLTNFGQRDRLTVDGLPVGRLLPDPGSTGDRRPAPAGSCIVVIVTDGPLDAAGCTRLARRAGLGLARVGSTANHGSGEIFLALATGLRSGRGEPPNGHPITGRALDDYFSAAVEATEEATLNSLLAARTVVGRDGNTSYSLPGETVRNLLASRNQSVSR